MTSLDYAEEGFFARAAADPQLLNLVGTDSSGMIKIVPGWWMDTQQAADYPRITFFGMESPAAAHADWVRVQVDLWVWPGTTDPDSALAAIDGRLLTLFDSEWWMHKGRRLSVHRTGGRTWPTGAGGPLRRTRELRVLVG